MEDYSKKFMSDDFTQCMYMLRHYDSMNWDITKFVVSEMLLAVGACWSIYTYYMGSKSADTNIPKENMFVVLLAICVASTLFGILSLLLIGKNRKYFALTSRSINEYRNHAIKDKPLGFANIAGYWNKPDYPKTFDVFSTQMMCFYLVAVFTSVMAGASCFMLGNILEYPLMAITIVVSLVFFVVTLLIGFVGMKD